MQNSTTHPEQRVIRILAHADSKTLGQKFDLLEGLPDWKFLRKPEAGLVMVRGRIGGSGGPFNFGEVTVTRAAVSLDTGETGFSYALGRDKAKAQQSALIHALWKCAVRTAEIEKKIIVPLECGLQREQAKTREEIAPTKVEFYTMVRGDG